MRRLFLTLFTIAALAMPAQAQVYGAQAATSAGLLCRSAIAATERTSPIPEHLLAAIGRVESGRRDPETGRSNPWPWTINVEGQGYFYETKAQAVAAARALQARGVRSFDVGCMQVNLMHHPAAFATLEQAFDPQANTAYAARFLRELFGQTRNWEKAAAFYHSQTPELGSDYQRRVMAVWPEEKRQQQEIAAHSDLASAWAATLPAAPSNRVAVVLPPRRTDGIRIIPLAPAGRTLQGSGLEGYRATPIAISSRQFRLGG